MSHLSPLVLPHLSKTPTTYGQRGPGALNWSNGFLTVFGIDVGRLKSQSRDLDPASTRGNSMERKLSAVDTTLARIANLAAELRADPDGHVRRSIEELRAAFATRGAIEPAVARLRESMTMLHSENHAGSRREYQRRSPGLDHLRDVIEQELLPDLRRLGFDL